MVQPTTPYMLRKDGKLLPCGDVHPYLKSFGVDDVDNVLELDDNDVQWYMNNTSSDDVKKAIVEFRKNKTVNNLNKLNQLINNEFCKVRTSNHKYKYGGDNGEIYFRLCNDDNFNWYDLIWKVVADEKDYIKTVTIMKDYETFGKQFDYCKIKGQPIKHMPVDEFLTMSGNPILESKDNNEEPTEEELKELASYIWNVVSNNEYESYDCLASDIINDVDYPLDRGLPEIEKIKIVLAAAFYLVNHEHKPIKIYLMKDKPYNDVLIFDSTMIDFENWFKTFEIDFSGYDPSDFTELNPSEFE